jgi:hypothetical protein
VAWERVLQLLVVNRLLDPGLGTDFAVAEKDRLYRCPDRVLEHKQELFVWLRQKWADLFQADFEVLLYDLTSTYVEGAMDRSIPSEEILREMRDPAREIFYLVGTRKARSNSMKRSGWICPGRRCGSR